MSYLARRAALFALTLLLISVVTFAITHLLPGDVAMMIMGTQSNPTALAGLRDSLGLNDPLIAQYGRWIGGMLSGDWGVSLRYKEPIATLIGQKVTASAMIVVLSLLIALATAIPLGVVSAVYRDRWQDTVGSGIALAGISLPDFFWGIVLILLFSRGLGWLPSSGFGHRSKSAIHLYTHERACPEARSARGRGCPMTRGRGSARGLVQCR